VNHGDSFQVLVYSIFYRGSQPTVFPFAVVESGRPVTGVTISPGTAKFSSSGEQIHDVAAEFDFGFK